MYRQDLTPPFETSFDDTYYSLCCCWLITLPISGVAGLAGGVNTNPPRIKFK